MAMSFKVRESTKPGMTAPNQQPEQPKPGAVVKKAQEGGTSLCEASHELGNAIDWRPGGPAKDGQLPMERPYQEAKPLESNKKPYKFSK